MSVDEPEGVAELPTEEPPYSPSTSRSSPGTVGSSRGGRTGDTRGRTGDTRGHPGPGDAESAARLNPSWTTAVGAPGGQGVRDPGAWALGYMGSLHQGADREGHGGPGSLQPRRAAPALLQPVPPRDPGPASAPRYRPHRGKAFGQLSLAAPRVSRSHVRGGC